MEDDWSSTTLGKVLSFSNGKTSPDRAENLPHPVYGSNGVIGFASDTNSDSETIVIGRVGTYCGSLYFSKQKCWVTDNAIRANAIDENGARFLYYVLKTIDLNHWRAGSGQPLLNQTILCSIPIVVPKPEVQRAIAHILGTLDDKIELNRRMSETLEAIARAIFKSWFVDSVQEMVPQSWRVGNFDELAAISRESVIPRQYPEESFDHYSIPAYDNARMPKAELGQQIQSNKFLVPPKTIMLSKLNPRISRVWFPKINFAKRSVASTEFIVLCPRSGFNQEYLYGLLQSEGFQQTFKGMVTGTSSSHQRVKPEDLLAMEVLIPPSDLVEQFSSISKPLYDRMARNLEESKILGELRDTLLPKLVSGKLRVVNSRKQPEAVV
ncbi:MAG: restriction endonuclease subunit S [Candidatus Omnitrophica bacterium]|nr:restriction endonuclease subunit S [Candidatus Omnitrophota bacterium]